MVNYVYPNLPNFIDPATVDNYQPHFVAEVKKNGWRCVAWKKDKLQLWTRRKTLINFHLPVTRGFLDLLPPDTMIDGELLDRRTKDLKDHYYAFDVMYIEGESVMHLPWWKRREKLELLLAKYGVWVELSAPVQVGFSTLYEQSILNGDEGIVIKDSNSKYIVDLNNCPYNPSWFKAKQPDKHFINKEA